MYDIERKQQLHALSKYTFPSFDNGIRQKLCSRMLYGIACGTRGWVYISNHGVGYDIPSQSAHS